jgi:hypothetical protein
MPLSHPVFSPKGRLVPAAALTALFIAGPMANAAQAAIQVPLGTASAFSVLAGSTVTNTGPTTISRNVGLAPGTAVTGADEMTVAGEYHVADAVALDAKNDLTTAYNQASSAAQDPVTTVATDLGETTLVGGTYDTGGAMAVNGQLTLDAQDNPDTVWVFRTDSTLITGTDSSVIFTNGGNPCNVFWRVGSSATLGVRTEFIGTILASTTITMDTGATLEGRALASTGAVNLHSNRIFGSGCANEEQVTGGTDAPPAAAVTPTATPTATPTTSGSGGGGGTTGGSGGGGGTTTTSQIERTPTGSVDTGYAGPVSSSRPALLTSALTLLTVLGAAALVAVRRRRTM